MTPAQALHTATIFGAELMQMQNDIGTIEPGKYADVIAVSDDPLKDPTVMENVKFVMKGGMVVKDEMTGALVRTQ